MEHFAVGLRIKSVIQVDPVVYVDGVQFIFMMKLAPEAIFVVYQTENDCNQSNVMILSKKFVSRILLPDVSNGNHRGKSLELITPNLFWDCMRREREKSLRNFHRTTAYAESNFSLPSDQKAHRRGRRTMPQLLESGCHRN